MERAKLLIEQIDALSLRAPFRHMVTKGGKQLSVAMFNVGALGWVSDRSGYRYDPVDPETGQPWPPFTPELLRLARNAATIAGYLTLFLMLAW